jgi:uncharacterized protein
MVEAIWMIDPHKLWQQGIRALLLDLDNTLVDWRQEYLRPEVSAWARVCRSLGIALCICTNARRTRRVVPVAARLGACYVVAAGKPGINACRHALELVHATAAQTAMIGDQVFTDIWGANRAGLISILVKPLCPRDFPATKITRFFERRVLQSWRAQGRDFRCEY